MGGVIEGLTEKIVENTLGTEDESAEEKTRFTNGHERPALAHSNQFEMHGRERRQNFVSISFEWKREDRRGQGTIENLH